MKSKFAVLFGIAVLFCADSIRAVDLSGVTDISSAVTPTAGVAGTSDINGSTLDMAGYESVLIVVRMGTITATAVTSIKVQQDTASDMSGAQDLAGTAQTIADDDDDKTFYVDLIRPAERYVRLVVDRGTANAVVASASYIQYGAAKVPTTHDSSTSGETHKTPAEGTAWRTGLWSQFLASAFTGRRRGLFSRRPIGLIWKQRSAIPSATPLMIAN